MPCLPHETLIRTICFILSEASLSRKNRVTFPCEKPYTASQKRNRAFSNYTKKKKALLMTIVVKSGAYRFSLSFPYFRRNF
jgi:hypothetical protein